MTGFTQVQETLDRILGIGPLPNHGAFWRGKTRDEFVGASVFGLTLIVVGDPESSNLIKALRGDFAIRRGSDPSPRRRDLSAHAGGQAGGGCGRPCVTGGLDPEWLSGSIRTVTLTFAIGVP